jgi:hypothetical protein
MENINVQDLENKKREVEEKLLKLKNRKRNLNTKINKSYRNYEASLLCAVARETLNAGQVLSITQTGVKGIFIELSKINKILSDERYKIVLEKNPHWGAFFNKKEE